jgi:hypothetical protein
MTAAPHLIHKANNLQSDNLTNEVVVSVFKTRCKPCVVQGDQKVSVHLMITVQKTRKNILNASNHLP